MFSQCLSVHGRGDGEVGLPACITGMVCIQGVCIQWGLPPGGGLPPSGSASRGGDCVCYRAGGVDAPPPNPPRYMGYYGIRLTSGRWASYLNAFLLCGLFLHLFDYFRFRFQMEHELRMSSEKCAALYEEKLKLEDQVSAIQSAQFIAQNQIQQMQNELKEAGQGRVELSAQLAEVVTERQVFSGFVFLPLFYLKVCSYVKIQKQMILLNRGVVQKTFYCTSTNPCSKPSFNNPGNDC